MLLRRVFLRFLSAFLSDFYLLFTSLLRGHCLCGASATSSSAAELSCLFSCGVTCITWIPNLPLAWLSIHIRTQMVSSPRAWRVVFGLTASIASAMESPRCMPALTHKLKTCFWNSKLTISIAPIICRAPLSSQSSPVCIREAQHCGK